MNPWTICSKTVWKIIFRQTKYKLLTVRHGRNLVGDTGSCVHHFFRRGHIICRVAPTFSLGFVFWEVSKRKVMFVTFCVKSFSC